MSSSAESSCRPPGTGPRSWAESAYPTLNYFHQAESGGHFAAWEEPELFAAELGSGDLVDAGGLPIAADLALIPAALVFGAAAPVEATAGTLINLVGLIPGI